MKRCPAPDCSSVIEASSTACLHHRRALPPSLRSKITRLQRDAPGNVPVQLEKAQRIWASLPPRDLTRTPPEDVPAIPNRYQETP